MDDDIDILDIGYTYDTGKYEEPAWDFRKNALVATAIEEMKPLYPELKVFDNETAVLHGVADVRMGTSALDKAEYVRLVERAVQDIIIDGRVLTTPAAGCEGRGGEEPPRSNRIKELSAPKWVVAKQAG